MHGEISCNNKISFSGFSFIMEMAAFELEVFMYAFVHCSFTSSLCMRPDMVSSLISKSNPMACLVTFITWLDLT